MSQDPSSRSRYPPPGGDSIQVLPAVSFESANATAELPGKGSKHIITYYYRAHLSPLLHVPLHWAVNDAAVLLSDGRGLRAEAVVHAEDVVQPVADLRRGGNNETSY